MSDDRVNGPKTGRDESTGRYAKGAPAGPGRPSYPEWFRGQLSADAMDFLAKLARGEEKDPKVTRGMACLEVLDRVIGKPKQAITIGAARGLLARLLEQPPPAIPEELDEG